MGKLFIDHVLAQIPSRNCPSRSFEPVRFSHDRLLRHSAGLVKRRHSLNGGEKVTRLGNKMLGPGKFISLPRAGNSAHLCQSRWALVLLPSNSTLPVIGTLPDHFAESVRLARNSQHSCPQASESQFRATWMLQDAAGVANCNTYNRNQPVRELRKGLFFRGRRHGAGIDSTSESFRTAFHTIYDLTGIHTTDHCRLHAIQTSDYPRHAPSVQC